mmetsp:Transcript_26385/g.40851  ORF Transcript_26385/g.40851 Transcript_26385/m.40851 type:complete len:163 (-) Transcript_26385:268-756(-)|eukprot:CAMPEP_0196813160 /NCGR_PEP_ID=MMETSP1362-20130617/34218_1 /TAXON_ID=163516 /ORGANISM="Leptocylindrus danicus, Strain CCMP1856" /LENGTH=162 /DNA_ID=CAMNT_0042189217 /DNA_START=24 /DNA_END=512 /DNA_ORIENTATION=+
MTRILLAFTALTAVQAFTAPFGGASFRQPLQLHSRKQLNEVDYMCIMNVANLCKEDSFGCDLDQIEAIRQQLIDQVTIYKARLDEIDALFDEMYAENAKPKQKRNVNQLRETVRAIARLFMFDNSDNDYPDTGVAIGFSGDRKGGGKTAYDVLAPKKMKKTP